MTQRSMDAGADVVAGVLTETLGGAWTLTRPRDGWAETAWVAERDGRRVFIKTKVLVPVLRRLAELQIVPPLLASGDSDRLSFIIQDFVEAPYPEQPWFVDHLGVLRDLIRTYQQDPQLISLLAARSLTCFADDLGWVEQCWCELKHAYGEHAPLQVAYARLLDQLPELGAANPVATHGDLSRKNLLPTRDKIYLVDWDEVSLSDPMRDIGPFLWWYVPPHRWREFFRSYGSTLGDGLIERVYWWAARASLEITHGLLAHGYWSRATDFVIDFLAAVDREENPYPLHARPAGGSP